MMLFKEQKEYLKKYLEHEKEFAEKMHDDCHKEGINNKEWYYQGAMDFIDKLINDLK